MGLKGLNPFTTFGNAPFVKSNPAAQKYFDKRHFFRSPTPSLGSFFILVINTLVLVRNTLVLHFKAVKMSLSKKPQMTVMIVNENCEMTDINVP